MSLYYMVLGFFIIKGVLAWPFYYGLKWKALEVGLALALFQGSLFTMLYHETNFDFWALFLITIVFDTAVYFVLLRRVWWKAILLGVLLNLIGFIFFIILNG